MQLVTDHAVVISVVKLNFFMVYVVDFMVTEIAMEMLTYFIFWSWIATKFISVAKTQLWKSLVDAQRLKQWPKFSFLCCHRNSDRLIRPLFNKIPNSYIFPLFFISSFSVHQLRHPPPVSSLPHSLCYFVPLSFSLTFCLSRVSLLLSHLLTLCLRSGHRLTAAPPPPPTSSLSQVWFWVFIFYI